MRASITIALFVLVSLVKGQVTYNYTYISPYKFSEDILSKRLSDSTADRLAWDLSFIGEYKEMLRVWDVGEPKMPNLDSASEKHFAMFKPIIAKEFLKQKAKTEQIIIFNEAHQQPYHRIFTTSVLEDLYKEGFRYFGAETLADWDMPRLNDLKYPTGITGYYTDEPTYGNLIREALRIGFKVFAYESNRMESDSGGVNIREIEQARNIKKVLDKDPQAKIIIHCGFGHIIETPMRGWGKAMAGRLKEYTGIDPYTIDQIKLTESSTDEYTNPYLKRITSEEYIFLVDTSGKAFNGPPGNKDYDARVFHPKTKWLDGRPHWMFEGGRKSCFVNQKVNTAYPCLVFAFVEGERFESPNPNDIAIPFDLIELKSKEDKKALSLKKGKYNIVVKSKKGEVQKFKVKVK